MKSVGRLVRSVHRFKGCTLRRAAAYQVEQKSVIDERIARIISLKQRKHYNLALDQARILALSYPNEPQIEALYAELIDLNHEQRRLDLKERS